MPDLDFCAQCEQLKQQSSQYLDAMRAADGNVLSLGDKLRRAEDRLERMMEERDKLQDEVTLLRELESTYRSPSFGKYHLDECLKKLDQFRSEDK